MCKELHYADSCIKVAPAVLTHLQQMPAGTLKVYLVLCSLNKDQSFSAAIPKIKAATGLETRSVNTALKTLSEKNLIIIRRAETVNRPNWYSIPMPAPKDNQVPVPPAKDSAVPAPLVVKEPEAMVPPAIHASAALASNESVQVRAVPLSSNGRGRTAAETAPTSPLIRQLIAACYRPVNDEEFARMRTWAPGEAALCQRLERMKQHGYTIAPDKDINYFAQRLNRFAC